MNGVRDARDRGGFVPADSVLAVTAREIIAAHQPGPDTGATPVCRRCGAVAPCATVRAAAQVVAATGVPFGAPGTGPAEPPAYAPLSRTTALDAPLTAPPPAALPMRNSGPGDVRGGPVRIAAAS